MQVLLSCCIVQQRILVALSALNLLYTWYLYQELWANKLQVDMDLCLVGVLLTAQPSVLFGASGSMSISQAGIAVGITQVWNGHRPTTFLRLASNTGCKDV